MRGGRMLFANIKLQTKSLRTISLIITLIGIIFILLSRFIGNFAIRFSMTLIFLLCAFNLKTTYKYSSTSEKINNILGLAASIIIFINPQLAMFIIGVGILILTVPVLYRMVRGKDYSDTVMLILSVVGLALSIYCILNSGAALNTVIIIIGISFVVLGCLLFFETFNIDRNMKEYATYEKEDYHFKDME
jgi:uncharacterized membrane protein HdeD (DUF308 family)